MSLDPSESHAFFCEHWAETSCAIPDGFESQDLCRVLESSFVKFCFKRWQSIVDRKFWFEHAFRLVVLARGGAAAGGLLGRGRCDLVPGRATHSDRVVAQGRLVSGGTGVVMHNTQHPAKWGWGGA